MHSSLSQTNRFTVRRYGDYDIIQQLGDEGYFARAYLAENTQLKPARIVIKIIHPHYVLENPDDDRVASFKREAKLLEDLAHINRVVRLYDSGEVPASALQFMVELENDKERREQLQKSLAQLRQQNRSLPFLALEYVDAPTLEYLAAHRDAGFPELLLKISREFLALLADVHRKGIAYRDIKENHIFWHEDNQSITVIDWNASNYVDKEQPNQTEDLFNYGRILYQLFTGQAHRLPNERDDNSSYTSEQSLVALAADVRDSQYLDLGEGTQDLPFSLRFVLQKLLALNPADRYPSADAVLSHLKEDALLAWVGQQIQNTEELARVARAAQSRRAIGISHLRVNENMAAMALFQESLLIAPTLYVFALLLEARLQEEKRRGALSDDYRRQLKEVSDDLEEVEDYPKAIRLLQQIPHPDCQLLSQEVQRLLDGLTDAEAALAANQSRAAQQLFWRVLLEDVSNKRAVLGWQTTQKTQRFLAEARVAYKRRDYAVADRHLQHLRKSNAWDIEATLLEQKIAVARSLQLAASVLQVDDFARALDEIGKALRLDPENNEARNLQMQVNAARQLLEEGKRLLSQGEYQQVADRFSALIETFPKSSGGRRGLDQANKGLEALAEADRLLQEGNEALRGTNWSTAENCYTQARSKLSTLALTPPVDKRLETSQRLIKTLEKARDLFNRARAALERSEYQLALDTFKQLQQLLPESPAISAKLAEVEQICDIINRARRLEQEGQDLFKLGKYTEADDRFAQVVSIQSDFEPLPLLKDRARRRRQAIQQGRQQFAMGVSRVSADGLKGKQISLQDSQHNALYEVGDYIGEGRYAFVHRAVVSHPALPQQVALKFMHPDRQFQAEFAKEVEILTRLADVPWVMRLLDHGLYEERPALVLELCAVEHDLEKRRRPFALAGALAFCLHVFEVFRIAHERKILYNDMKGLHLIWNGSLKMIDWNVSKMACAPTEHAKDFEDFYRTVRHLMPAEVAHILADYEGKTAADMQFALLDSRLWRAVAPPRPRLEFDVADLALVQAQAAATQEDWRKASLWLRRGLWHCPGHQALRSQLLEIEPRLRQGENGVIVTNPPKSSE